jgi:hypothetical protein
MLAFNDLFCSRHRHAHHHSDDLAMTRPEGVALGRRTSGIGRHNGIVPEACAAGTMQDKKPDADYQQALAPEVQT